MTKLNNTIQLLNSCERVNVVIRRKFKIYSIIMSGYLKSFTKNCNDELEIFLDEYRYYISINEIQNISMLNKKVLLESERVYIIFEILA